MDKKVNTYMTKVRDYYRHKEGYGDKMSTDEVLKRVIKYSGDTLSLESDSSFNTGTDGLEKHRQAANELWTVESERPITSHRRIIGRFIVFGKKVLRKISRWYINPIVEAQNKFNGEITAALNEICNKLITLEGNSEMLQAEISESNQRLSDLIYQKEMEYKRQLEETEQQLKAIKKQYELGMTTDLVVEEIELALMQLEGQINSITRQHNQLKTLFEKPYLDTGM